MDQEPDAGDDQDHYHGELVHLQVEADTEVAGRRPGEDPIEKFLSERLMGWFVVAEKFADGLERAQKREARRGQRDRIDGLIRPLGAQ